jgi:hypothetical protein
LREQGVLCCLLEKYALSAKITTNSLEFILDDAEPLPAF